MLTFYANHYHLHYLMHHSQCSQVGNLDPCNQQFHAQSDLVKVGNYLTRKMSSIGHLIYPSLNPVFIPTNQLLKYKFKNSFSWNPINPTLTGVVE